MTPGLARAIRRLGDVLYNKYSLVDDSEGIVNTSNTLKLHRVRISMTLSSISRVFISNPSAIRAQKYDPNCAIIHIHFQKIQHLDFLTDYLRLVHRLMHHPVLELQAQDVVLLMLRIFYTYVEALTAFSPGGRPVSLGFELLQQKEEVLLLASTGIAAAHNIGGRNIHAASGTESSIALVRQ